MNRRFFFMLFLCFSAVLPARAQLGSTINLRNLKPAAFARKMLRAEKTSYGKLGGFQKLMQNTFTQFNYLYNANKRFDQLLKETAEHYQDDYTQLLPFFPYDEASLAKNSFLDSVIQHATSGILLHDLRNSYVDELYFLLGKSYFFEQKYDTAHQIFQYLNYAFGPKDEGYDLPIGSNISNKERIFTIATREKTGIAHNGYNSMERRNDALLWQAKNYIKEKDYVQAGALLDYLQQDIYFPLRLKPLFFQTKAYSFYQQKKYDSAANNLVQCEFPGNTRQQRARQYFLAGQLYQLSGENTKAVQYFEKANTISVDPLMSIYAAMNVAALQSDSLANTWKAHIALLDKLSKKEKFASHKDVIYFAQAKIAAENNDTSNASAYLHKSIKANRNTQPANPVQKSKSFFALANLEYRQKNFYLAAQYYDSVSANYLNDSLDKKLLNLRNTPLHKVAANTDSIMIQDSLQALAALPEKQRYEILKQAARRIRKSINQRSESDTNVPVNAAIPNKEQPADLFNSGNNGNTEWYFNNQSLKSNGYRLFKQKYGNRPNVDNWQRLSAINASAAANKSTADESIMAGFNPDGSLKTDSANITPEDLLRDLPTTKEQIEASNNIISEAMLNNGKVLQNELENFVGAIPVYDSLIYKFPKAEQVPEALYNIYVCYTLLGKNQKAEVAKQKLHANFAENQWDKILQGEKDKVVSSTSLADTATGIYNDIYNLFIEGKFEEAQNKKLLADQKYGTFYWTPQLLYIEAVYNIAKNQDSIAIDRLNYLLNKFSTSPMTPRAKTMLDVLKRRNQIEDYLRKLQISPDDYLQDNRLSRLENAAQQMDEIQRERRIALIRNNKITSIDDKKKVEQLSGNITQPERNALINVQGHLPVDSTIVDERKDSLLVKNEPVVRVDSSLARQIPLSPDTNAINNHQRLPQKDSVSSDNNKIIPEAIVEEPVNAVRTINGFTFNDNAPEYVAVLLHNVAPVYATEAGNAFNRYNLSSFEHESFKVTSLKIADYDFVLIGPFKTRKEAESYRKKIQPAAQNAIIFWLTDDKYQFIHISPANLEKIKADNDVVNYLKAVQQNETK